jgi:uncharacterized protein (TIGR03435 family)
MPCLASCTAGSFCVPYRAEVPPVFARFLALLLPMTLAGFFGQVGVFGPVSTRPEVGDLAPDIAFTKVLSEPQGTSWLPSSLFGQMTLLEFYPDTSHNLESVKRWNAMIDQFAGKPVQFVWLTGEEESSLALWLADHPLKGFVLLDPTGATGRSYGMEMPASVIIGANGRIIGFDQFVTADTLNAALEGRTTAAPLKPGTPEMQALIENHLVHLGAQAPRLFRSPERLRPNFPPSYILHVAPSQIDGTGNYAGPDFKTLQGFDVKNALSEVYDVSRIRIELPPSFDHADRYDFSMVLPETEDSDRINERFRQGILDHFHLTATREKRLVDVYVLTAPDRKSVALKPQRDQGDGFSSVSVEFATDSPNGFSISAVTSISVRGTMDDFCKALERTVDRPVVNEANLKGQFELNVKPDEARKKDFPDRLRDQLGLVVEPDQRNTEILTFNPR